VKEILYNFLLTLTPYLVTSILAIISWMLTFQKWREVTDYKILVNECRIIDNIIDDKRNNLTFKQSSLSANMYAKSLNNDDALDYYKVIQNETNKLIRDIDNLETIYKSKCLDIT
jgi:hypothetical protein